MRTTLKRGIGRAAVVNGDGRAVLPPGSLSPVKRYRQPERTRTAWRVVGRILFFVVAACVAVVLGIGWLFTGLVLCYSVRPLLGLVGAGYVALTIGYTLVLGHIPVFDIVAIAGGFVLRALAGGVAAPVTLSRWFVLVVTAVAVFIAAGKRQAEVMRTAQVVPAAGDTPQPRRRTRRVRRTTAAAASAGCAGPTTSYSIATADSTSPTWARPARVTGIGEVSIMPSLTVHALSRSCIRSSRRTALACRRTAKRCTSPKQRLPGFGHSTFWHLVCWENASSHLRTVDG